MDLKEYYDIAKAKREKALQDAKEDDERLEKLADEMFGPYHRQRSLRTEQYDDEDDEDDNDDNDDDDSENDGIVLTKPRRKVLTRPRPFVHVHGDVWGVLPPSRVPGVPPRPLRPVPSAQKEITCHACGQTGHNSRNKNCPVKASRHGPK